MAVPYKIAKRTNALVNPPTTIYYPVVASNGTVKTPELKSRIANQTTISEDEAKRFVEAVVRIIADDLANGFSVKFSKLGTFSPSIKAKIRPTADDVTYKDITKKSVRFTPSVELKTELKNASFNKVKE